jgi:hypothetical protein
VLGTPFASLEEPPEDVSHGGEALTTDVAVAAEQSYREIGTGKRGSSTRLVSEWGVKFPEHVSDTGTPLVGEVHGKVPEW